MPNHESLFKHLRFAACLVIVLVSLQKPCYLNGLRKADYASGLWLFSPSGPDPRRRRLVSAVLCPTWVFLLILGDAQRTSPLHRWPEVSPALTLGSRGRKNSSFSQSESLVLGLYVRLKSTAAAERCWAGVIGARPGTGWSLGRSVWF